MFPRRFTLGTSLLQETALTSPGVRSVLFCRCGQAVRAVLIQGPGGPQFILPFPLRFSLELKLARGEGEENT